MKATDMEPEHGADPKLAMPAPAAAVSPARMVSIGSARRHHATHTAYLLCLSRAIAAQNIFEPATHAQSSIERVPNLALALPKSQSLTCLQEHGADIVSGRHTPEQAVQDVAPAADAGGGKAVKLGCSKCRMSRKGCSVCRVKAGLGPLVKTHPSPRKYACYPCDLAKVHDP